MSMLKDIELCNNTTEQNTKGELHRILINQLKSTSVRTEDYKFEKLKEIWACGVRKNQMAVTHSLSLLVARPVTII